MSLTELMGSEEYKWGPPQEKAFKQMKVVIAKDTLLAYAGHNKKFYIETDASDYQLGGRIFQKEYQQEDNKTVEHDRVSTPEISTALRKTIQRLKKNCCRLLKR